MDKKANILYLVASFAYLFSQWLISVLIVRITGYEDAGIFSLAMTMATTIGMLMTYGMRGFQVSDVSGKYSNEEYIYSRVITVLAGVIVLAVWLLPSGYDGRKLAAIALYTVFKVCEAIADVYWGIMQNEGLFFRVGVSMLAKGIVCFAAFMAVYIPTGELNAGLFAMAASSLALLIALDILPVRRFVSFDKSAVRVSLSKSARLLKEAFLAMLYAFITQLFTALPRVMLEKSTSEEILGYFSSIYTPTVVISTFAICIMVPYMGRYAEFYSGGKRKELARDFLMPITWTILICALALVLSRLCGEWALALVFGDDIRQYADLLDYAILSVTAMAVMSCFGYFMTAVRKLRPMVLFSSLSVVLCVILSAVMIDRFSLYGVAYAMLISHAVVIAAEGVYIYLTVFKTMEGSGSR